MLERRPTNQPMPETPVRPGPGRGNRPASPTSIVLALSALAVLASLARFCPDTVVAPGVLAGQVGMITRGPALVGQLHHPLGLFTSPSNDLTTNALRWRLLVPVLAHLLHLPSLLYLLLPRFGSGVLVATCAVFLYRLTGNAAKTLGGALLVATSSSFLVGADWISMDPWFLIPATVFVFGDGVAAAAAGILAPWADERMVIFLLPFALLRLSLYPKDRLGIQGGIAGTALYGGVRAAVLLFGERSVTTQIGYAATWHFPVLRGWYFGFGVGWIAVFAGFAASLHFGFATRRWVGAAVVAASLAASLGALAYLSADTTRAIAVCLPFLLVGVQKLPGKVVLALAAMSLILPTGTFIAEQYCFYAPCFVSPWH